MTAIDLLDICRARDVRLTPKGDRLLWNAPKNVMTPELLERLKAAKAEIRFLIRGDYASAVRALIERRVTREADNLWYRFNERAGICEFDGNMVRSDAERLAYAEIARVIEGSGQ